VRLACWHANRVMWESDADKAVVKACSIAFAAKRCFISSRILWELWMGGGAVVAVGFGADDVGSFVSFISESFVV